MLITKSTALRMACLVAAAMTCAAAEWRTDVVDPSGAGKYSSLKVDKAGNVHVVYVLDDGNRYPLRYAFWDKALGRWFNTTVAQSAGPCSLALDSNQRPNISWVDFGTASGSKLRYGKWNGERWVLTAIPLNSDVISYYNSIVLDSQDRPTITFYEYRGPKDTDLHIRLRSVRWNGKYWEARTIDPEEGSGKFNSAAVDAHDGVHVAYANVSSGTASIRYAYWNGTAWKAEIIEGTAENKGDSVGYSCFIALDAAGDPHITYVNESTPALKYAVRKDGRWKVQTVERLSGVAYPDRNSIALDEDGIPYLGYYDAGRGILKVAHWTPRGWQTEVVDQGGCGFTSSMQVADGAVWISYTDAANGAFKVAHRAVDPPKSMNVTTARPARSQVSEHSEKLFP